MKRLLVCMLLLAGCRETSGTEEVQVAGRLSLGWETTSFRPCGVPEDWLPLAGPDMHARYDSVAPAMYEPVFARFRGTLGPRGRFGHVGANDRELRVTEVLEIRELTVRDCR